MHNQQPDETPAKALSIFRHRGGRLALRFTLFSRFLGVGHNEPRGTVQIVGDGLHDVLRMRFDQPHVPRRAPVKPSAHGAKRALYPASRPANPCVELLLAR